jgi:hypothetical protein
MQAALRASILFSGYMGAVPGTIKISKKQAACARFCPATGAFDITRKRGDLVIRHFADHGKLFK